MAASRCPRERSEGCACCPDTDDVVRPLVMKALHTPMHLKAPHGATTTEITWGDGVRCIYPNAILRGYCPCAHCQGHGGTIEFVPGGNSELREIETVGYYALKLVWGDGHDTGLYTFEYLRSLADRPEVTCVQPGAAS